MSHPVRLQTGSHRDSHQDSDHSLQTGTAFRPGQPSRPSDLDDHQTWTAIKTQTGTATIRLGQPSGLRPGKTGRQPSDRDSHHKTIRPGQPSRLRPEDSDRDSHQDSDHTQTGTAIKTQTTLTPGPHSHRDSHQDSDRRLRPGQPPQRSGQP